MCLRDDPTALRQRRPLAGAAQHRAHAGQRLAWRNGFVYLIVGASFQVDNSIDLVGKSGQNDYRYLRDGPDAAQYCSTSGIADLLFKQDKMRRLTPKPQLDISRVARGAHAVALLR